MDLGTETCTFEEIHVKETAQAIVGAGKSEIRRAGSGCCREAEFLLRGPPTPSRRICVQSAGSRDRGPCLLNTFMAMPGQVPHSSWVPGLVRLTPKPAVTETDPHHGWREGQWPPLLPLVSPSVNPGCRVRR